MAIQYKNVVPWGRSYDEYCRMFALREQELARNILGCGDGPASFNAIHTRNGGRIVSMDPVYQMSGGALQTRIDETAQEVMSQMEAERHRFVWTEFQEPSDMGKARLEAMAIFLADLEAGRKEGRYVTAELPNLPVKDKLFDLALTSHFLFLYSDHLDTDFHRQAIKELLRVAKEVRIFPLVDLQAKRSVHLDQLLPELERSGMNPNVVKVPYEFQRGGNEMLVLTRT